MHGRHSGHRAPCQHRVGEQLGLAGSLLERMKRLGGAALVIEDDQATVVQPVEPVHPHAYREAAELDDPGFLRAPRW